VTYGQRTQKLRENLIDGPEDARRRAQAQALDELARCGPRRSKRQWWAFEGHTEVDCWLETEHLLLFVEGKRTDTLSSKTDWFPVRDQLVRNLEVIGDCAGARWAGVLLVTETPEPDLTMERIVASSPHLTDAMVQRLFDRYLGQTTWRTLCERLDLNYLDLPETVEGCP
jgi:hypothetical protein